MKLNLPNFLTIFRIITVPVIALLIITQHGEGALIFAFFLFLLSSLTDYLDGLTARKFNQSTEFGKVLDPIADKLMSVILLSVIYGSKIGSNFPIVLGGPIILIIFREIFISGLREHIGKESNVLKVSGLAKIKTVFQLLAIGLLLAALAFPDYYSLEYAGLLFIWIAAILTFSSGLDYFIKAKPYFKD